MDPAQAMSADDDEMVVVVVEEDRAGADAAEEDDDADADARARARATEEDEDDAGAGAVAEEEEAATPKRPGRGAKTGGTNARRGATTGTCSSPVYDVKELGEVSHRSLCTTP